MTFDADERIAIYLEAFFCNMSLKSFTLGIYPNFDGDESEAEKMTLFSAAEAKSQKVGLRILTRKNNTGNWDEIAEIILVNRGRKDYFDLLQPYLAKNSVSLLEKNDALGVQLIDYGNGLLKADDFIKIKAALSIVIAKKNDVEALQARISALELALEGKLINLPSNTLLGRNTNAGVVETISQTKFATPAMLDQAIIDLVGGAPGALNTLIELASALNNDANFSATVTNALALKAPLSSPVFTGFTTLGDNVAIKCKQLTGVTGAAQGDAVSIAHGLTGGKIIFATGVIQYTTNAFVPIPTTQTNYSATLSSTTTHINIGNQSANSAGILSKPVIITLFYIP